MRVTRRPLLPLQGELFAAMEALGNKLGFSQIAYGMNADDTRDFRPGQRAAEEHAVLAPLAEVGLTKAEVRALPKLPAIRCGIVQRLRVCLRVSNMAAP